MIENKRMLRGRTIVFSILPLTTRFVSLTELFIVYISVWTHWPLRYPLNFSVSRKRLLDYFLINLRGQWYHCIWCTSLLYRESTGNSYEGRQQLGGVWRQLWMKIASFESKPVCRVIGLMGIIIGIITTKGLKSAQLTLFLTVYYPFLYRYFHFQKVNFICID